MAKVTPVVMAGGSGTRLWPLSRKAEPKQFKALLSERTMLEDTLARLGGDSFTDPVVIGSAAHRALIEKQLPEGQIVLEPFGRDTGPAAITAALLAEETDPDALVLLLPADHYIADAEGFRAAVARGIPAAEQGYLVTLGITPDAPETGYGYIRRGDPMGEGVFAVDAFVEKPERARAEAYLAEGNYAWNAGIFLFRARDFLAEAEAHAGPMLAQTRAAFADASRDGRVASFNEGSFGAIDGLSVDYAVMEKTSKAAVVSPVTIGWNDIGSWAAVKAFAASSDPGAVLIDCPDTFVQREEGAPMIAAAGLEGFVIVSTKDAVLILPEDRAQDVKKIVEALKKGDRTGLL